MKRNKYLEDIGINNYGASYGTNTDKRRKKWKKQREKFGFDERETWNLNDIYAEWLYSRLMMFRKKAGKTVDLDYHIIPYKGKSYTLNKAIKVIIKACREYLKSRHINPETVSEEEQERIAKEMQEALHLWAEIFPYMWW